MVTLYPIPLHFASRFAHSAKSLYTFSFDPLFFCIFPKGCGQMTTTQSRMSASRRYFIVIVHKQKAIFCRVCPIPFFILSEAFNIFHRFDHAKNTRGKMSISLLFAGNYFHLSGCCVPASENRLAHPCRPPYLSF